MTDRTVSIAEAAHILGISTEALRTRYPSFIRKWADWIPSSWR
jgi:hypothetical protein